VVSSSQAGSSPVKWRGTQGPKGKEKEVMGLARRARGLMEEVKGLSGDSPEGEVEGILRRAEGLKEDAVSVKALAGVKVRSHCASVGHSLMLVEIDIYRWSKCCDQQPTCHFGVTSTRHNAEQSNT